jgi:hypothetical protein
MRNPAIQVLINREVSSDDLLSIPPIDIHARSWVWQNALSKNDYYPLLLPPQELISSLNTKPGVASWLVGSLSLDRP